MNTHTLFPTTICEFEYDKSSEFKENLWEVALSHIKDGYSNETNAPYLHHEEKLRDIYAFITKSIKEYLGVFNISLDDLDFHISKSYFNLVDKNPGSEHHHLDSHMSFIYYAHIPDDVEFDIRFFAEDMPQPHSAFFDTFNKGWNWHNSSSWVFKSTEGCLFLFPGSVGHEVVPVNGIPSNEKNTPVHTLEDLKKMRISIAGDGMFTFKHMYQATRTHGVHPISTWKTFPAPEATEL